MMIGNAGTLKKSDFWEELIEDCKAKQVEGGYFKLDQDVETYTGYNKIKNIFRQTSEHALYNELDTVEVIKECEETQIEELKEDEWPALFENSAKNKKAKKKSGKVIQI